MKNKSDLSKHDKLEISKEAALFRTKNGLSANEPIKIKSFLLKLNVQTFFLPLEENIWGCPLRPENSGSCLSTPIIQLEDKIFL